jgi:4,5:9,10-diseco-3-hydroxy-5,9,17-trioxoandrosta-1(10),2-diene-4-oate hydrolase
MNRKTQIVLCMLAVMVLLSCSRSMPRQDLSWRKLVDGRSHDVAVKGLRMHYIELGAGQPVVMIHGIADSTYSWHENAQALADAGLRIILVDQPGFGKTDIPASGWTYSVENQGEAILGMADQLGLERFSLVGHSLGGGISLYMAWKHPERIDRVAVIDPASQRTSCPFGFASDLVKDCVGTRWFVKRGLRSAFFDANKVTDAMIDEYARLIDRPGRAGRGVLGGVCGDFFSPTYDLMTQSYGRLKPTLLIIWGREDTWHPLEFGTRLQTMIPGSQLEVIPQAGHNVHQERPDLLNPILIRFLGAG